MNFKPILFSPLMVKAIQEDRKTMTRRIMNPQPDKTGHVHPGVFKLPYRKGDILYVREEHYAFGLWQPNGHTDSGRQKWKFVTKFHRPPISRAYCFEHPGSTLPNKAREMGWYKRLGRFMPKAYARTFLEVINVQAERVNDITDLDAEREGVERACINGTYGFKSYETILVGPHKGQPHPHAAIPNAQAITSFKEIWVNINGITSWDDNLWVFVVSFKRIDKPANFLS